MLKRLTVAVAALIVLASSAFGAGTVPGFSLAQQQDSNGAPLVGCKLYTIQAGSVSTPQSGYQDSALTLPLSNPIICDAYGRLPQIFLADGSIKLRLTKSNGVQVFAADGILVVGASSGGGGGSPVDATTILATGDLKARYGTGVLTGFVRANGRTVGSATSGATERANADCQTLFEYLWTADTALAVSGGRGGSANSDWVANKTIALPDWRGRTMVGMDDMGNSAAGVLTSTYYNNSPIVLGNPGGQQSLVLTAAQIPSITSSASVISPSSNFLTAPSTGFGITSYSANAGAQVWQAFSPGASIVVSGTISSSGSATSSNTGGTAHATVQPSRTLTFYMKL